MDTAIFQPVHRREYHGTIFLARVENVHLQDPAVRNAVEHLNPVGLFPGSTASLYQLQAGNYLDLCYFLENHLKQNVRLIMHRDPQGQNADTVHLMTWDPGHTRTELIFRLPLSDEAVRLINQGIARKRGIE